MERAYKREKEKAGPSFFSLWLRVVFWFSLIVFSTLTCGGLTGWIPSSRGKVNCVFIS